MNIIPKYAMLSQPAGWQQLLPASLVEPALNKYVLDSSCEITKACIREGLRCHALFERLCALINVFTVGFDG